MPLLPNELVGSIIEELYDDHDSIRTLQNCALVARAWVYASQRGIFRCIRLRSLFANVAPRVARLISLFDANPCLATYVQHLDLVRFKDREYPDNVSGMINRLSNLGEIKLSGFDFGVVSPALAESLLGMMRCPSLTTVIFYDIGINRFVEFASLLSNLAHLKSLVISHLCCDDWSSENSAITGPLPVPRSIQLTELGLTSVPEQLLDWFQQDSCPFGYQKLWTLRLSNDTFRMMILNYERVASIIQCVGRSLRELELGRPHAPDIHSMMNAIHLGYTPNLRSLTLSDLQQADWYTPVPWIESLFRPLVNSDLQCHPLRFLTIHLSYHCDNLDHPNALRSWDEWTAIDSIFEKEVFVALEKVTFSCYRETSDDEEDTEEEKEKLGKLIHKTFPFLAGSGKLHIDL